MAIHIKIAHSATERDELFRLRHRVFVDQGGYMQPRPDQRIYDRFDSFPDVTNLIAIKDKAVIGGVRLAEPSAAGTPADEYFDYRPHLPSEATRVGSASMLCLDRTQRYQRRVAACLVSMFYYLATRRGLTHILAPTNPEVAAMMLRKGCRRVAPTFRHESGIKVAPLMLEVDQVENRMVEFAKAHSQSHWLHSLERSFYCEGETVIEEGAVEHTAYVVLEGVAFMETAGKRGESWCRRLEPGDMIGELSLLTGRPATAMVVAATDLDLMVVRGHRFRRQLKQRPEGALALLEQLGKRLDDALTR